MVVFLCGDNFEHILCGVYDAWDSSLGYKNVKLGLDDCGNREMFCRYQEVSLDREKAMKVIRSVKNKISEEALRFIYEASLSREEKKADWIYRFLVLGFHYGRSVTGLLQYEPVYRVFELSRSVRNEAHCYLEFLRFSDTGEGILVGRIGPKNDVLTLLAPHFADRLPEENWVIYDANRKKAAFHEAGRSWFVSEVDDPYWQEKLGETADEEAYRHLWKVFFNSIAIRERSNASCQRTHLPPRYREYMTEFR